jgi:hypothetical protein
MIMQGHLTPQVSQHVILGRIKIIGSWDKHPLTPQHTAIGIFYLIIIGKRGYRMLTRLED